MSEDAKAAKTRRLAEALRANLRRRKAAATKAAETRTARAASGTDQAASGEPVDRDS